MSRSPKKLTERQAVNALQKDPNARLIKTCVPGGGREWFILRHGGVAESTAHAIFARPDCRGVGDGLFGDSQTFVLRWPSELGG